MGTHLIPDKIKAKIDRMYQGVDKERITKALESGKTVYIGKVKLRGMKVDKDEWSNKTPAPPASSKMSDSAKAAKDK